MAERLGIRRWGDRCFHKVDEERDDGYVVQGFFIHRDDVEDVVKWDDQGDTPPTCDTDSVS